MSTAKAPRFHVFISHSSEDRTWADAACEVLERRKMKCWIAPRDITPGTEWGAAIVDGIDRSRVMVLIFSANANQSPQVRREVERAISKSVPILPLRIEDIRPQGAMEFALSNTHWLDAFAAPADERLAQLAESVMALLGVKQEKKTATQSVPILPVTRRRRSPMIAMVSITCIVVAAVAAFVFWRHNESATSQSSGTKTIGASPDDSPTGNEKDLKSSPTEAKTEDETQKFQGRWISIAESTPSGVASEESVKEREYSLVIQDHSVTHRRHPTNAETATLTGFISFQKENDTRTFTIRGTDGDGVHRTWIGLYRFNDDALELCYRESEGRGVQPIVPTVLSSTGQRGTHYVKLVRPRGRKKR